MEFRQNLKRFLHRWYKLRQKMMMNATEKQIAATTLEAATMTAYSAQHLTFEVDYLAMLVALLLLNEAGSRAVLASSKKNVCEH